jgi:phosphatidylglycerol:prolipoprotein diacylglycerol transferase
MHPILFKLGPVTVYSYGVMVALGFAVATACVYARAPKFNIDRNHIVDLMIIMLVSGLFGARLFYVIQNTGYYRANPYEILNLSKGGLVWYGAFFAGFISSVLYMKLRRMDAWLALDLAAPYIALAQAIGRIGCFLNGCCYGISASCGGAYVPTQLYSAAALALLFVILRIWQGHRHFKGEIFLGYCALYSAKRFLMEFLRGDNPRAYFGFTISQVISCALFALSLSVFTYMAVLWRRKRSHST